MSYPDLMREYYSKEGVRPDYLEQLMSIAEVINAAIPDLTMEQLALLGRLFNASFQMGRLSVSSEALQHMYDQKTKKKWPDSED
jgi:hypothetical protein